MILKEVNIIKGRLLKVLIFYTMPYVKIMAGWQSGYAAACKAVYSGSIPDSASILGMDK
jgi:hypothetical protein